MPKEPIPICPVCGKPLEWTGSSSDFAVYTCPIHKDFHRHHVNSKHRDANGKLDHDHGGGAHV